MADLRIDLDDINGAVRRMGTIETRFRNAEQISSNVADVVGHRRLANKVNEFASNWSIHRDDILSSVGAVKETLTTISTEFTNLEKDLKSTIENPG